jgi:DNA-binding beta-propeller fold protein YncE
MAMDTATRRIFVGCRNKMMAIVNADTGKVIKTMPIGDHVDAAAFDAATKLIYCSNGDGTVSVFHEDSADAYSAVQTITTEAGAKTMTLDPKTRNIYLSVAERKGRVVTPDTFHILIFGQ